MTTEEQGVLLYKESETPQKCVQCSKETKRLVNTAEFEAEPEWIPLCNTECEEEFEQTTGDDCGG